MRIEGSTISRVQAFDIMASALSGVNGFPQITDEEMKKRFIRYKKMYKDTRRWKDSTSANLIDIEIQNEYEEDETFGDEEANILNMQVEAEVKFTSLYDYKKEYHDRYQELCMQNLECQRRKMWLKTQML
ncbi:hypothetical protein R1flu_008500 [Riccia fluitans]|uniref:Uncharacterized protein n=1 Tax=Riccia fluitans TaxID=41844 RepID=A0ABD1YC31_9MARC